MVRFLTGLLMLAVALLPCVRADEVELNPDHPTRYSVVRGDTLWDIAGRFLRKPWHWPRIWQNNPQIRNPHLIYPGDEIVLTYVDGRPRLTLARSDRDNGYRPDYVRLSPRVRETAIEQAIPVIPPSAISQFLTQPRVVSEAELDRAPYVVAFEEERISGGGGDRIYVRAVRPGDDRRFVLFRKGQAYVDPITREPLGQEAEYIGETALERPGDPASLLLVSSQREALIGDRLLPVADTPTGELSYFPRAPDTRIAGHIIQLKDAVFQTGQYQIVTIDRGLRDGLEPGHVLEIYRSGVPYRDIVTPRGDDSVLLPDELSGVLLVFRPFERVSYAVILHSSRAVLLGDAVRTPE